MLIIYGDTKVEEPFMFQRGMYLHVFYCLCYVEEISTYMLGEKVSEDRDMEFNEEENIRTEDSREEHWKDVDYDGDEKKKIHALRWEVYTKYKEELIEREFLVSVPHPKWGNIL